MDVGFVQRDTTRDASDYAVQDALESVKPNVRKEVRAPVYGAARALVYRDIKALLTRRNGQPHWKGSYDATFGSHECLAILMATYAESETPTYKAQRINTKRGLKERL